MSLEEIYSRLPFFLQNFVVSCKGYLINRKRYGSTFQRILNEIRKNSFLSEKELKVYQEVSLRDHMRVSSGISFWKKIFSDYDVDVDAEDIFSEYLKLPILSKSVVQENIDSIFNPSLKKTDLIKSHTSGTTGAGLIFWDTRESDAWRWAVWWRYRESHGIKFDFRCAYFGGRSIVPIKQATPPFWRYNASSKQMMYSAYHLSERTAKSYIESLIDFQPDWLHGYPSFLCLLASYIKEFSPNLNLNIKIITIGAESLLSHQKFLLESVFACEVRQHYGLAESVANFSECENGKLHVDEDLGYVEFVPTETDDNLFRIIGTNWKNSAFPLIRYDTGDLATLIKDKCSCGRSGRIVAEVDGRKEDFVVLPNGSRVGRLDHVFKDMIEIREAQIVQKSYSGIVVRVVPGHNYDAIVQNRLLNEFRRRLGEEIDIDICIVRSLDRTKGSKLRFVISELGKDR